MTTASVPMCGEHRVSKEWRPTTFEYHDQGISVRVPNVYAWVCPVGGETSFTPETVDELILTVRALFEAAQRTRERQSGLREYIVSVG